MKRNPGGSFVKYKKRRAAEQLRIKELLKGRMLWVSVGLMMGKNGVRMAYGGFGTYIRAKHEELGAK